MKKSILKYIITNVQTKVNQLILLASVPREVFKTVSNSNVFYNMGGRAKVPRYIF